MNSSDVQIVFPGDSDHLGSGYNIFVMVAFSFSLSQGDVDGGRLESQYLLLMTNRCAFRLLAAGAGQAPGGYWFCLC